ncbi:hypothetical protein [Spirillospora sp. NPDC047279]|uniref:hypothetical protein n=1 Tax=Spirillospora sp. NPDC047279 TaxID=3155478 RepID=UPI0033E55F58
MTGPGGMEAGTIARHVPFLCPYGHELGAGRVLVGWSPCDCPPALGWHRGHRTFECRACAEQRERVSICYLPPHVGGGHPARG